MLPNDPQYITSFLKLLLLLMLGKRQAREEEGAEETKDTAKRARTHLQPKRTFLAAVRRCAQDLNIQGLTELLLEDPTRTTDVLDDPTRSVICRMFEHVFSNKLTEDYLYFLATEAMLPWKRLLGQALQRNWITSDDWRYDDDLVTVPLFADLPDYKTWLLEQVRCRPGFKVLSAVTFASASIIEWAYQHNNVELLKWCRAAQVGGADGAGSSGDPITPAPTPTPLFSAACWSNFDGITGDEPNEATAKWWREHVSKYLPDEMSGSPGGESDDQHDALDAVDALVAGTPENEIVDLTTP